MRDLKGRAALITGASAGIGVHVARAMAEEGANLVLAARRGDLLEGVAREMREIGVEVVVVPTDVADDEQLNRLVGLAVERFGAIDVLVNNAGIEAFRGFELLSPHEIRRAIEVNLLGTLILSRLVIPHMIKAGRGHIVNMSSIAGKYGPAFGAVYGAGKAGMIAFTQSLRSEYHGTGISASVICPGFVRDGGIYEELRGRSEKSAPWYIGSTTSAAVASAVVGAIRRDRPEVIVNRPPHRSLFAIAATLPRFGEWLLRIGGRRYMSRISKRDSRRPDSP